MDAYYIPVQEAVASFLVDETLFQDPVSYWLHGCQLPQPERQGTERVKCAYKVDSLSHRQTWEACFRACVLADSEKTIFEWIYKGKSYILKGVIQKIEQNRIFNPRGAKLTTRQP